MSEVLCPPLVTALRPSPTAGRVIITVDGRVVSIMAFTVVDDRIVEIDAFNHPEQLSRIAAGLTSSE